MAAILTTCLGEQSTGCISLPYMQCCADHKCTPLPDGPVHTIKLLLSKATGLWKVETEMFCHEKKKESKAPRRGKKQVRECSSENLTVRMSSNQRPHLKGKEHVS